MELFLHNTISEEQLEHYGGTSVTVEHIRGHLWQIFHKVNQVREPPNNINKILRDFCSEAGLTTPGNYLGKPTFYHHDNKSSSQIDYLQVYLERADQRGY